MPSHYGDGSDPHSSGVDPRLLAKLQQIRGRPLPVPMQRPPAPQPGAIADFNRQQTLINRLEGAPGAQPIQSPAEFAHTVRSAAPVQNPEARLMQPSGPAFGAPPAVREQRAQAIREQQRAQWTANLQSLLGKFKKQKGTGDKFVLREQLPDALMQFVPEGSSVDLNSLSLEEFSILADMGKAQAPGGPDGSGQQQ